MLTGYNISLTESALNKIHSLMREEGDKNSILRIVVLGGGCSGFKYNFLMDQIRSDRAFNGEAGDDGFDCMAHRDSNTENKDVIVNDQEGNPILMLDDHSAGFLNNSTIDYTESLNGSGFQIKNALAKSTCGCGNSFSV